MKKRNLITTLAIIAISAVPLMAYEFDTFNIDKELIQDIKAPIVTTLTELDNNDVDENVKLYCDSKIRLARMLKDESLKSQDEKVVLQQMYSILNDLAKSILEAPSEFIQTDRFENVSRYLSHHPFVYLAGSESFPDGIVTLYQLWTHVRTKYLYYGIPGYGTILKSDIAKLMEKFPPEY